MPGSIDQPVQPRVLLGGIHAARQQAGTQRHGLMRATDNLRHEIVQTFGQGNGLVRMPVLLQARKLRPELPSHWQARLIQTHAGGQSRRCITSVEIELGFREIRPVLTRCRTA
jgi:hypothetical protein